MGGTVVVQTCDDRDNGMYMYSTYIPHLTWLWTGKELVSKRVSRMGAVVSLKKSSTDLVTDPHEYNAILFIQKFKNSKKFKSPPSIQMEQNISHFEF